ncbi:hypothetical protein D3C86_1713160 [compost metagenome]
MFSIFGVIPTAERTTSASNTCMPVAVLTFTLQISPDLSTDSTEAFVMMLIPAFLKLRSNPLETSSSSTGTIFGKNSTTVTLVPIEL